VAIVLMINVFEQTKVALRMSMPTSALTLSRVEAKLLADRRTGQHVPNPDLRRNRTQIVAMTPPLMSARALAARIDLVESDLSRTTALKTAAAARSRSTRLRKTHKRVVRMAYRAKPIIALVRRESVRDITLRNLVVADLPTKKI